MRSKHVLCVLLLSLLFLTACTPEKKDTGEAGSGAGSFAVPSEVTPATPTPTPEAAPTPTPTEIPAEDGGITLPKVEF